MARGHCCIYTSFFRLVVLTRGTPADPQDPEDPEDPATTWALDACLSASRLSGAAIGHGARPTLFLHSAPPPSLSLPDRALSTVSLPHFFLSPPLSHSPKPAS
jgi:hypothetical protein